jgi:hypothetical protein
MQWFLSGILNVMEQSQRVSGMKVSARSETGSIKG